MLLIQRALNTVRHAPAQHPIREDGLIGPETIEAISAFQRQHTTARDGRVDPDGPTFRALEDRFQAKVEPVVRIASLDILRELNDKLYARRLELPASIGASVSAVSMAAQGLRGGTLHHGLVPGMHVTLGKPAGQRAVAVAAAPAAAAGLMEATILALAAMVALLFVIQSLPAMGRAMEELLRKIQVAMSVITNKVKEGLGIIEELIRNNPAAGMRCSSAILAFRQLSNQILDLLVAPRPTDELGRRRWQKRMLELMDAWHNAFNAVLACMGAS